MNKPYLKCDRCRIVYDDEPSVKMAKAQEQQWRDLCESDGVAPRGICPCPNLRCKGELHLIKPVSDEEWAERIRTTRLQIERLLEPPTDLDKAKDAHLLLTGLVADWEQRAKGA